MERKQIIAKYWGNGPPSYYTGNDFNIHITEAKFFDETETERTVTKLSRFYPGYIWEIKTVYHV